MEESVFIQKIQEALSKFATREEAEVAAKFGRPGPGEPIPMEERLERFMEETKLLHKVEVLRAAEWEQGIGLAATALKEKGLKKIAVAGDALISPQWVKNSLELAADFAAVERADVGVVQADYGLAETGSVVLIASPDKPRIYSLLPPVCYFFLEISNLLDGMPNLMAVLDRIRRESGMPATVNVVTGPSRTADIELSLTVGVHGPGEVHVILIG